MKTKNSTSVAFGAGVFGAFVMALGMALFRAAGITQGNVEMQLGKIFFTQAGPITWTLGFFTELLFGGCMGIFYAAQFQLTGKSGWILGASMGLAQWLVIAIAFSLAASVGQVLPFEPGNSASYMGGGVTFGTLFGPLLFFNLVYGSLVAEIYQRNFPDVGTVGLGELAAADQDQLRPDEDKLRRAA